MSTFMAKKGQVQQRWYLIDATGQVVGRLAVQIATLLRGKHRPDYTPPRGYRRFCHRHQRGEGPLHWQETRYGNLSVVQPFSGAGLKTVTARELLATRPERILLEAVKRMVPRNRLGRQQMAKFKIYAGPSHPHQAQQPQEFKLES